MGEGCEARLLSKRYKESGGASIILTINSNMSTKPFALEEKFGFGTMSLTWTPKPKPIEEAVETMKFITSNKKFGTKFLNGGEFYGPNSINLKYIKAFLDGNTDEFNRELIFSIKGAVGDKLIPDASEEGVRSSIDNVLTYFPTDPTKRPKIIFQAARVDPKVPYVKTIEYISEYVKAGKIDGISISEVGPETIQKAGQVAHITSAELELSILCQDILSNGCVEECSKGGVAIVAYSPLCRGYLTDYCAENADTWLQDIPAGDIRHHFGKFSPENYAHNIILVKNLYNFAHEKKNVSLECLALSWISSISNRLEYKGLKNLPHIIAIPSGSTKERLEKNLGSIIHLSDKDLEDIQAIVNANPVQGRRYGDDTAEFS